MKFLKISLLILSVVSLFQCTETKRGCLDITASNFDVDADEPCEDDCCQKTQLRMSFIHRYWDQDSIVRSVGLGGLSGLFADTSTFVQFSHIHFYLTDFQMIKSDGSILETTSTETIESDPPLTILDNNAYFNRSIVNAQNLGDFTPDIGIERLRFNIGIEGINNQIHPDSLETSHPFGPKADTLNWTAANGYSYFRMEFLTYEMDSVLIDSTGKAIEFTTPDVFPIEIVSNFDLAIGLDTRVTLIMNYNELFKGIDPVIDSEQTIKTKIRQNISGSFLFDSLEQSAP